MKGAHGVSVHSGEGTRTTRAKDAAGLLRGREERGGDGRDRTGNANRGVAFAKCQVRQITLFRDGQVGCLPGTGSRGEAWRRFQSPGRWPWRKLRRLKFTLNTMGKYWNPSRILSRDVTFQKHHYGHSVEAGIEEDVAVHLKTRWPLMAQPLGCVMSPKAHVPPPSLTQREATDRQRKMTLVYNPGAPQDSIWQLSSDSFFLNYGSDMWSLCWVKYTLAF